MQMKVLYKAFCLLGLILFSFVVSAQTVRTVSGKVTDAEGKPVPGAVVLLEGSSSVGTATDENGKYSLKLPVKEGVIVVQCLGYDEVKRTLGVKSIYDFTLGEDAELLERAVVVGYGSMRESDITGSVTSVKVDEENAAGNMSVDQMLKGRAAGVSVISNSAAPGAGFNIKIRGNSSFNGSGEPLYVVDGVLISSSGADPTILSKAGGNYEEENNGLLGIDPDDIASMEILKDASATAIYGAMGANGVVLITTKTARKDRPVINFRASFEVSDIYRKVDMLDLDGYVAFLDASGYTNYNRSIFVDPNRRELGYAVNEVDWQDHVSRTAFNQRYSFSVANRVKGTKYMFSLGYDNVQGILLKSGMNQFKARLNLDQKISRDVSVGLKLNLSRSEMNMLQGASSAGLTSNTSFIRAVINGRPFTGVEIDNDTDASEFEEDYGGGPARWLKDYQDNRLQYRIIPNAYLQWKISHWLTFKAQAGADFKIKKISKWRGPYVTTTSEWALAAVGLNQSLRYNFDAMFLFDKSFGRHNISGTLGTTYIGSDSLYEVTDGWNINQYVGQISNINAAQNARIAYSETKWSTLSFLLRGVYSYRGRYILTATVRGDGSSRFSKTNRWSVFPSAAFAWRINEEPWFTTSKISQLKLRMGWGQVGNQAVSPYQTLSNYGNILYGDHSPGNSNYNIVGVIPVNLANPDLKWETTQQSNIGIDFKLNRNRFSFTLDLYNKDTYDLLQTISVPATTGYSSMWVNLGHINNRGIEFTFDASLIKKRKLEWSVFGNISRNVNRIVSLGLPSTDGKPTYFYGSEIGNSKYCKTAVNIFIEGQPMGLFYGIETDGLVQEGDTGPGMTEGTRMPEGGVKYVDRNNNGYVDTDDRTVIGDPNPDFIYGFGTNLTWKNLSFDMSFSGSYGNDIANLNLIQETDVSRTNQNIRSAAFYDSYTSENKDAKYPKIGVYDSSETQLFTDRFVEDGSYLRLSNVSVGYNFPMQKKKSFVKNINLSLNAGNLFFITKYSGYDPEVNSYGGDIKKMGVDYGSYPSARSYALNVKFTF